VNVHTAFSALSSAIWQRLSSKGRKWPSGHSARARLRDSPGVTPISRASAETAATLPYFAPYFTSMSGAPFKAGSASRSTLAAKSGMSTQAIMSSSIGNAFVKRDLDRHLPLPALALSFSTVIRARQPCTSAAGAASPAVRPAVGGV
jgi:hypothetical protein